ncbi:flavin monoamine oxidase family protein [Bacillus toyonensis]
MGRMTLMRILKQAYLEIYKALGDTMVQPAVPLHEKKYIKKNEKLATSMMLELRDPFLHLDGLPSPSSSPKIVIVGAGLAGLACAYRLKQAGYTATIYEANERVGGRVHTRRGDFADDQFVEAGGEFIGPGAIRIQQLVTELGLQLDNLTAAELPGTEIIYYFNGAPYSFADLVADFQQIFNQIQTDVTLAGFPTLYNHYTQRGFELDHMSVTDYISTYVPGGMSSRLGKFLDVTINAFLSSDSSDTSALSLVYGLSSGVGEVGEQLRVHGGNDQIPKKLKQRLHGQIEMKTRLIALKENANGSYTLTFQKKQDIFDVEADHVVMTIPFTILRSSVDYSQAGIQPLKVSSFGEKVNIFRLIE